MPFKYHPPTRDYCHVCEKIAQTRKEGAIITSSKGKASSAANFPFHNWYYFVLGYSPQFPDYILQKYGASEKNFVVDPFMGTGTTLVACKTKSIPSGGVDANDFFYDVARAKTNWSVHLDALKKIYSTLRQEITERYSEFGFLSVGNILNKDDSQLSLFANPIGKYRSVNEYDSRYRPKMLDRRYISPIPFTKWHIIKNAIDKIVPDGEEKDFFNLAIAPILVPISNIRYGPGFGIGKPKSDANVYSLFQQQVNRMISDLESVNSDQKETPSLVFKGDSRRIEDFFERDSVDLMITSPPYPGDHEYTKHTRLELIAMGYAQSIEEFRVIKQRMLRGSTTNIYKQDNDQQYVKHIHSISEITELIDQRLKEDGATSGFEKLYTKLVWEYFGGMSRALRSALRILKPGGTFHLLVSDSHAFKMVHIQTAKILAEIGLDVGYRDAQIVLWQEKTSTSHRYRIMENILTLKK